jgi:hypothetical protein
MALLRVCAAEVKKKFQKRETKKKYTREKYFVGEFFSEGGPFRAEKNARCLVAPAPRWRFLEIARGTNVPAGRRRYKGLRAEAPQIMDISSN